MDYHVPVMLRECLEGLKIGKGGVYVDATFGGGGHSKAILEALDDEGRLFGFDRDVRALDNRWSDKRLKVIHANYSHMQRYLKLEGVTAVNGILADLGVSSHQLNNPERGFSFRFDEALDMRMDRSQSLDARHVVNEYEAGELQRIFSAYGEVRNARTLARAIVEARKASPVETTGRLGEIASSVAYGPASKYLARVFQAIRIEVNGELDALKAFLEQAAGLLVSGGRLVVIAYHSLEDRLVKHFMRYGVFEGEPERDLYGRFEAPFRAVAGKPLQPSDQETEENPRARSARLRIAEKQ